MSPRSHEQSAATGHHAGRVAAFFTERLGLDGIGALLAKKAVPVHRMTHFYYFGGMALFLFAIQVVTGALLSLYYKPSPDQAFESVRAIVTEVDFGWLIRSAHAWSANLLVGVLLLHALTAYMIRAYRRPRELTWVTGLVLLAVFMAFGFSGYLLPWNELAFFATRVGTAMVGVVPLVGEQLLLLARSGEDVTGDTLARFYALHVVVLPLVTILLLGVHLYLVQKHGMSIPDGEAARLGGRNHVPQMTFIPHFLLRDMVGWYLALAILAILAAVLPWELGQKADPFGSAPEGIRPEWYFVFMFQALRQLPAHILGIEGEVVGVLFFAAAGLVGVAVPFLDRGNRSRTTLNVLTAAAVVGFIVLTAWGYFDEAIPRLQLASGLLVGMFALAFPLTANRERIMLIAAAVLAGLLFAGATIWGMLL